MIAVATQAEWEELDWLDRRSKFFGSYAEARKALDRCPNPENWEIHSQTMHWIPGEPKPVRFLLYWTP